RSDYKDLSQKCLRKERSPGSRPCRRRLTEAAHPVRGAIGQHRAPITALAECLPNCPPVGGGGEPLLERADDGVFSPPFFWLSSHRGSMLAPRPNGSIGARSNMRSCGAGLAPVVKTRRWLISLSGLS